MSVSASGGRAYRAPLAMPLHAAHACVVRTHVSVFWLVTSDVLFSAQRVPRGPLCLCTQYSDTTNTMLPSHPYPTPFIGHDPLQLQRSTFIRARASHLQAFHISALHGSRASSDTSTHHDSSHIRRGAWGLWGETREPTLRGPLLVLVARTVSFIGYHARTHGSMSGDSTRDPPHSRRPPRCTTHSTPTQKALNSRRGVLDGWGVWRQWAREYCAACH